MALSYAARRRWSLIILLIGLPVYVVLAISVTGWMTARFGRLPFLAELLVYVGLGILWALPFRVVFRGVGKEDPNAETERSGDRSA